MRTVLVTGCFGYIGKKLVSLLLNNKIKVIGSDIKYENLFCSDNFIFAKFDSNDEYIEELKKYNIDTVYHLAWVGVSSIDKNDYTKQFLNITITYFVLELSRKLKIKKIIIPGSISEFSKCNCPVTGNENDSPSDLYAATKVAIRKISYQFCEKNNIDLNWLLITSVYGNGRNDANLLTYTINNFIDNKKVLTTSLKQKWDYIYIDDLINAMFLIGEKGKQFLIYPIGSGIVHELSYYINFIADFMQKQSLLHIGAVPYKNNFIDNSIVDITELKKLGYSISNSFEENIKKVIIEYEKN